MGLVGRMKGHTSASRWMMAELWGAVSLSPLRRKILLRPYSAIYISVPKVACTSFKTAFARLLGLGLDKANGDPHRLRYPSPVPIARLQPLLYPGFYRFAFVRNPWDRLVSCYRDKIKNEVDGYTHFTIRPGVANCLARWSAFSPGMTFDEFAAAVAAIPDSEADEHFRSQHTFLAGRNGELAADFVGRYEKLADDFALVRERTGLPDIELPRLQAARTAAKYAAYYTPATRDLVARRFRRDIELFGYEFGS
jgi:chondroitin 4-sulfotransferase 11